MSLLIAARDDLPAVMQLYRNCVQDMLDKGIDQWGDFYPTEDILANDIKHEELYLLEIDNDLAGVVVVNEQADPQYATVQWQSEDDNPLIVHRLAIDPAYQGQGYAQMIMSWVEGYAKSNGYSTIRLDAYQGNPAALTLYEKCFYIKTGEVIFPHRSQRFNCYEKILKENHCYQTPMGNLNDWYPIYETNANYEELSLLLKENGFTVEIFCDPQCGELYTPGLQRDKEFGKYRTPLTLYVAVPRDQRFNALRVFEPWLQNKKREHLTFKMSTFRNAFSSTLWMIMILGIMVMIYRVTPIKFDPIKEATILLGSAPAIWVLFFLFKIHRQQPKE